MMKKNRLQISSLLTLLLCMLLLTACGASGEENGGTAPETPPQESTAAPETEEPSAQQEDVTLEELLGEDYVNYLTETITMQMGNRMEKDPEVRYFPIEDNAPLSDYVTIDETTKFEVDEEGNPVIYFPTGPGGEGGMGDRAPGTPSLNKYGGKLKTARRLQPAACFFIAGQKGAAALRHGFRYLPELLARLRETETGAPMSGKGGSVAVQPKCAWTL